MRLFEVANQPYEIHFLKAVRGREEYSFTTEAGEKYVVAIDHSQTNPTFDSEEHEDYEPATMVEISFMQYVDSGLAIELTGAGDAFRVFATVKEIVLNYLEYEGEPDYIVYSAVKHESSRVKLYDTIEKLLSRWLPNYEPVDGGNSSYSVSKRYIFQKKR